MKDIIVDFKKNLPLADIEQVLQDLGWIKFDPEHPKKEFDYNGLGKGEGETKVTITINEKRKTEEDVGNAIKFFHYNPFPEVKYDEYTFQASYEKAETLAQKQDIIAEYVGLKKRKILHEFEIHIGREKISNLEREKIKQYLNSFGVPFRFLVVDKNLKILYFETLPEEWTKRVPMLANIWADKNEKTEANFDWDFSNKQLLYEKYLKPLAEEFGTKNVQVRKSASGNNFHGRIINRLFKPKKLFKIRKKFGDSIQRITADKILLQKGLKLGFLYDWKYGKPASKWASLAKWVKENKVV